MGYNVVRGDEHSYQERRNIDMEWPRLAADVTTAAELKSSRARMRRYPPHTRGRRHQDQAQEEVLALAPGTPTILQGEPAERFDLPPTSVVAVEPMTPLQVRNESDEELVLFVYGAPPEQAGADFLDDPGAL